MDIFNAFKWVNQFNIKVVILGQDPTPTKGEATGIAFSLKPGSNPTNVSTGNIFRLLEKYGYKVNWLNGDLTRWAYQGVLLLNSALTINVGSFPDSDFHQNLWRTFTKEMMKHISLDTEHSIVWMLWGEKAKSFEDFIDKSRHLVLTGVHPSPKNGDTFVKQMIIFERANVFLKNKGEQEINWNLVSHGLRPFNKYDLWSISISCLRS